MGHLRPGSCAALRLVAPWLVALVASACGDEARRPIGAVCRDDSECLASQCIAGTCLDPAADEDGDGLTNGFEGEIGSNPLHPDTDLDGIPDPDELDGLALVDTDGDGKPDIIESATFDSDGDCVTDQFDPDDTTPDADLLLMRDFLCRRQGVCATHFDRIGVRCDDGRRAVCDYSNVPGWEPVEVSCDGLDNDCDGETDAGLPAER